MATRLLPLATPTLTTSGEQIFVVKVGGIGFYQDVDLIERKLVTVGAVLTAKDLLPKMKFEGRLTVRPALARISVMAGVARTADGSRLYAHVGIASLLALLGTP